ncbi:hypothetical protein BOCO_0738 [Bombiscardovia coagulans]|uniref:Uncharacterized protein n=1 Tax=Bombiscardovia coagulans TaxID=686666 RepID=A0A261ETN6_9BIFI|nr:hypothetical protein BOCO_0738 [Bombiscardovia coagulans]
MLWRYSVGFEMGNSVLLTKQVTVLMTISTCYVKLSLVDGLYGNCLTLQFMALSNECKYPDALLGIDSLVIAGSYESAKQYI